MTAIKDIDKDNLDFDHNISLRRAAIRSGTNIRWQVAIEKARLRQPNIIDFTETDTNRAKMNKQEIVSNAAMVCGVEFLLLSAFPATAALDRAAGRYGIQNTFSA